MPAVIIFSALIFHEHPNFSRDSYVDATIDRRDDGGLLLYRGL